MSEFASEGFDIRGGSGNVVHEIGGTETPVVNNDKPIEPPKSDEAERPLHATLKEEGNSLFKVGDYGGALDFYLRAVDEGEKSCVDESSEDPVPSFGEDLLHLLHEHKEYERKVKARERRENEEGERKEERRKARKERGEEARPSPPPSPTPPIPTPDPVNYPPLRYLLSTYHNNAAACLMNLSRFEECKTHCSIAIAYDDKYVKAYVRRSKTRECDQGGTQNPERPQDGREAAEEVVRREDGKAQD